jgi:hypothetical protein
MLRAIASSCGVEPRMRRLRVATRCIRRRREAFAGKARRAKREATKPPFMGVWGPLARRGKRKRKRKRRRRRKRKRKQRRKRKRTQKRKRKQKPRRARSRRRSSISDYEGEARGSKCDGRGEDRAGGPGGGASLATCWQRRPTKRKPSQKRGLGGDPYGNRTRARRKKRPRAEARGLSCQQGSSAQLSSFFSLMSAFTPSTER